MTSKAYRAQRHRSLISAAIIALLAGGSTFASGADLYKWVDDQGVTNYSNTPPPTSRAGARVTRVEDRLSVYTPDAATARALKEAQERPLTPVAPAPAVVARAAPRPPAPVPPPNPYDPCVDASDPYCWPQVHYGPPVYRGRIPPRLVQPHLPPGAIAGNVHQDGYLPGQSAFATPPRPSRHTARPGASFTEKGARR